MQKSNFVSWVVKPVKNKEKLSTERLQELIRATCLRRMKWKTLKLPPRSERTHEVHLHQDDQVLYDHYKKRCTAEAIGQDKRLEESSSPKDEGENILSLIQNLRLICNHGKQLIYREIKGKGDKNCVSPIGVGAQRIYSSRCSSCEGEIDRSISGVQDEDSTCFNCRTSEEIPSNMTMLTDRSTATEKFGSVDTLYRPSAKVLALLENLKQERAAARGNRRPRKRYVPTHSLP